MIVTVGSGPSRLRAGHACACPLRDEMGATTSACCGPAVLIVMVAPWITVPELGAWGLPVVLLVCFFLFGVKLIGSVVEEPFGRERDDLDLDRYCRTICESVEAVLHSATDPGRLGSS
jgi:Bestrophin, RFP-TM, chloride channel